jgi:hypothetical protein
MQSSFLSLSTISCTKTININAMPRATSTLPLLAVLLLHVGTLVHGQCRDIGKHMECATEASNFIAACGTAVKGSDDLNLSYYSCLCGMLACI